MMQREEILSLYCLFEIERNISCAALYQLLSFKVIENSESEVKTLKQIY